MTPPPSTLLRTSPRWTWSPTWWSASSQTRALSCPPLRTRRLCIEATLMWPGAWHQLMAETRGLTWGQQWSAQVTVCLSGHRNTRNITPPLYSNNRCHWEWRLALCPTPRVWVTVYPGAETSLARSLERRRMRAAATWSPGERRLVITTMRWSLRRGPSEAIPVEPMASCGGRISRC